MNRILKPGQNCSGIYDVQEAGLLIDGRTYFKALYRAAQKARSYILFAGWQFDSAVQLLRGDDKGTDDQETSFLHFLESLCEQNNALEIYILAWDYSVLFAMDREWFQDIIFTWTSSSQMHYRFDGSHAVGASHHQKFVVIDGHVSFVGGIDISSGRWDDRRHLSSSRERVDAKKEPYEPYHDIQAFLSGPVSLELVLLFQERWRKAGGRNLDVPDTEPGRNQAKFSDMLPIKASQVAISRTYARTIVPETTPVREIRNLYRDAILSAEKLIYIENQYFSSQAVFQALVQRMKDRKRPKINIVLILPKEPHAFVEEISLGLIQAKVLHSLREIARQESHYLGIYYTLSGKGDKDNPATYIHAKLIIVDDTFLSIGSANMTNRSMGLDTELNVSWEETDDTGQLTRSVQDIRVSLLSEHSGLQGDEHYKKFQDISGLVSYLDTIAEQRISRLRKHTLETIFGDGISIGKLDVDIDMLDPEKPVIEENFYELLSGDPDSIFAQGITFLNEKLSTAGEKARQMDIPHRLRRVLEIIRSHWILTSTCAALAFIILLLLFKYF